MAYRNNLRLMAQKEGRLVDCKTCTGAMQFDYSRRVVCKRPLSSEAMGLKVCSWKAFKTRSIWPFDYDATIVEECKKYERARD